MKSMEAHTKNTENCFLMLTTPTESLFPWLSLLFNDQTAEGLRYRY